MRVKALAMSLTDPKLGAQAIVNASNPHIGLGSGVSGAIREACGGPVFQRQVRVRWEEDFDQPLEADDCLVTGAGTAAWLRWVLHVAAVDYKHPDPETGGATGPKRIRQCFQAALWEARDLAKDHNLGGSLILGTPLLGSGHGGLGEVVSLDAMMSEIRVFLQKGHDEIAEVRFAVMAPHLITLVSRAAEKHGVPLCPDQPS